MQLYNGFDLMEYAQSRGFVLPAFNTTNLEMTVAIARGLTAAGIPGYIQISSNNLKISSPQIIADIARFALAGSETPVGLHLDHGKSFAHVEACVKAGYTSIMLDASALPYLENTREVRRAADYCHAFGIPVEAELGILPGKEDDDVVVDGKTDPAEVAAFVAATGCDMLAVSVGNVHGITAQPNIDLPLLAKIAAASPVPLVFHGGSGIPIELIREAKASHLIKINYGSVIRKEFIETFGKAYESDHNAHDVIHLSVEAIDRIAGKVSELAIAINR